MPITIGTASMELCHPEKTHGVHAGRASQEVVPLIHIDISSSSHDLRAQHKREHQLILLKQTYKRID